MKGKAHLEYDGSMKDEDIRMSEMLQQHLTRYGHFPSDADSDPFWCQCRAVFATRFSLRQLKSKIFSLYRQQQEILQSCAPGAPASQTVEPQVKECGGATEQAVGGPFSRFCRTHFPSRFSFRDLKRKVLSFHQQFKWQTAIEENNESPAPSGSEDHCAQPSREERASEDANLLPHPALLAEGSHLPTSNHQSGAKGKAKVAGKTLNLRNWPLTISEESSPQRPRQAYAGGDTIPLDYNIGSRGDREVTNLQVVLILTEESNHLPATICHSNTQVKSIAAADVLNVDHQSLSIDDDAPLQLRQFHTAGDKENKSGTEADFEGIHLQLDLTSPQNKSGTEADFEGIHLQLDHLLPTKDAHLPKRHSDAKERAIVAGEDSKPHEPPGNDSPLLQPLKALTRVKATPLGNSDIQNAIDVPMERPTTKKAQWDTLSKPKHRSCKQATPSKASAIIHDNFQAVGASSSGPVFANNADAEEDGGGAYGNWQNAKSLHHLAAVHDALSILQHADNRRKKRLADARGVDARHQIKVLRQSAILDLAQTRVTLSQIAFHSN